MIINIFLYTQAKKNFLLFWSQNMVLDWTRNYIESKFWLEQRQDIHRHHLAGTGRGYSDGALS